MLFPIESKDGTTVYDVIGAKYPTRIICADWLFQLVHNPIIATENESKKAAKQRNNVAVLSIANRRVAK